MVLGRALPGVTSWPSGEEKDNKEEIFLISLSYWLKLLSPHPPIAPQQAAGFGGRFWGPFGVDFGVQNGSIWGPRGGPKWCPKSTPKSTPLFSKVGTRVPTGSTFPKTSLAMTGKGVVGNRIAEQSP